jgi:hypothetical protein
MLHYVYYPFVEGSATGPNMATLNRYTTKYQSSLYNTHDEKATDREVLIYKPRELPKTPAEGPLHCVRDDDMLLIAGHGGESDPSYILNDRGEKLPHGDLAKQLHDMGLAETHVLIKMLSCFGGGDLKQENKKVVICPIMGTFFAEHLAKSLFGLGYHKIIVGGYAGDVNTGGAASRRSETRTKNSQNVMVSVKYEKGATGREDAHLYIVWVDGKGNRVTRGEISKLKKDSDLRESKFEKTWRGEEFKRTRMG